METLWRCMTARIQHRPSSRRRALCKLGAGLTGLGLAPGLAAFAGNTLLAPESLAAKTLERAAPAFTLPEFLGVDGPNPSLGPSVSLSDLQGQWIYLDFWASWCAPCLLSFPFMNELQDAKASLGIQVVAISVDRKEERLANFLRTNPARFKVLWDAPGQVAKNYFVSTMPTSFLINPKGFIVLEHKGFTVNTAASLRQTLSRHVSEKT